MSSEVRHLVDNGRPYPLVRLAGVLDSTTAPAVRSALLGVLAGRPEAMVVDVHELDIGDAAAVGVLRDVLRDTAYWPAARLTLCAADHTDLWQTAGWPLRKDCAGAFAELGDTHRTHRMSLGLEPRVGAARRARELITEACARWERPDLAGSACIVATEMVNNVVAHAHTEMTVLLATYGDGMTVAVRDHSTAVPSFTGVPAAPTAYGGRGMLLVDSVASRWGVLVLPDGKVVWALVVAEERASGRQRDGGGMAGPEHG